MAGLYNEFAGEPRYVILTTAANESIADVHNRMPVVLPARESRSGSAASGPRWRSSARFRQCWNGPPHKSILPQKREDF